MKNAREVAGRVSGLVDLYESYARLFGSAVKAMEPDEINAHYRASRGSKRKAEPLEADLIELSRRLERIKVEVAAYYTEIMVPAFRQIRAIEAHPLLTAIFDQVSSGTLAAAEAKQEIARTVGPVLLDMPIEDHGFTARDLNALAAKVDEIRVAGGPAQMADKRLGRLLNIGMRQFAYLRKRKQPPHWAALRSK